MASLADKQERAYRAANLMDPEGEFAQAMSAIEAEYIARWRGAKTVEEREDFHRKVTLLEAIKSELQNVITTGKIEADEQEQPKRGLFAWPM